MWIKSKRIAAAFCVCLLFNLQTHAQSQDSNLRPTDPVAAAGDDGVPAPLDPAVDRSSFDSKDDSDGGQRNSGPGRSDDPAVQPVDVWVSEVDGVLRQRRSVNPSEIRVVKEGSPVAGALVVGYLGYPVEVIEDPGGAFRAGVMRDTGSAVAPPDDGPQFWEAVTDANGSLNVVPEDSHAHEGQPVLVVHSKSGYAVTTLRRKEGPPDAGTYEISLNDWCTVQCEIEYGQQVSDKVAALARWESLPLSSELLTMSARDRGNGPGLFSMTRRVEYGREDFGENSVNLLPAGRLRFTALVPTPDGKQARTNIHWWKTVNPGSNELGKTTIDPVRVTGRVKLTDDILERITQVKRDREGRITVTRAPLILRISGTEFVPAASDSFGRPEQAFEAAIRRAIVWARPGGRRESEQPQQMFVAVADDGRFSTVLRRDDYLVTGLWMADDSRGLNHHSDVGGVSRTRLTEMRDVAISVQLSEPTLTLGGLPKDGVQSLQMPAVDLGEIDPGTPVSSPSDSSYSDSSNRSLPQRVSSRRLNRRFPTQTTAGQPVDDSTETTASAEDVRPSGSSPSDSQDATMDAIWLESNNPLDHSAGPSTALLDRSISDLITRILSAGDQKTRENLREPLRELLAQKFDAEQQAREKLVEELSKRLNEASEKVKERARRRDEIIGQQVQRMLGLPLDDFQPLQPAGRRIRSSPESFEAEPATNQQDQFQRDLDDAVPQEDRFRGRLDVDVFDASR